MSDKEQDRPPADIATAGNEITKTPTQQINDRDELAYRESLDSLLRDMHAREAKSRHSGSQNESQCESPFKKLQDNMLKQSETQPFSFPWAPS